mgnify:FL=1
MERNLQGQFVKGTNGTTFEGFGVWPDAKGYPCIWVDGKSIKLHVLVWERINGPKPRGCDVHHKDLDKGNYSLDNLQLLGHSTHQKIHAGWVMVDGEWIAKPCTRCGKVLPLSEFYPRKGYTPSALCKTCHNIVITERHNENPEALRKYKHDYYLRKTEGLVIKRRCQNAPTV